MNLRSLVLALILGAGLAAAADKPPKHPKPVKAHTPKPVKHAGPVAKPMKTKSPSATKHAAVPKVSKRKANKHKT